MTKTSISLVLDKLFAQEIALRPDWYQPGAPRECWLFVAHEASWLVVWDPSVRRVESATRYTESALRERLPQLAGAQVFDRSIVPYGAVDASLASLSPPANFAPASTGITGIHGPIGDVPDGPRRAPLGA